MRNLIFLALLLHLTVVMATNQSRKSGRLYSRRTRDKGINVLLNVLLGI